MVLSGGGNCRRFNSIPFTQSPCQGKNGFHSNSLERGQLGAQEKDLHRKKKPTAEKIASNDIRAALDLTLTGKIIT